MRFCVMLSSIQFDRDLLFRTIKVENILADRKLSSEFQIHQIPATKMRPQQSLDISLLLTQVSRVRLERRIVLVSHTTNTQRPHPTLSYEERERRVSLHLLLLSPFV